MTTDITFNVTVYFSNGVTIQKEVPLSKAAKLSQKVNVLIDPESELYEVKGLNGQTMVIPINMTFVINAAPIFQHVDRVSRYMLYKRDNQKCAYCQKDISQKEATIDHVIPRFLGGQTTWENCVLACRRCNCKKDNRTPEQAGMKLHVVPYNPKRKKNG